MAAGVLNLSIEQGATFTQNLIWQDSGNVPVNLTGYTARMQIRATVTDSAVLASASTGTDGRITLGATPGQITITFPASYTSSFTFTTGVYDLELESSGGVVTRLVQGSVTISPEVTR